MNTTPRGSSLSDRMSIDAFFLIPVPAALIAGPKYFSVDPFWKGDDYVIIGGEPWDDRLDRSARRRHALAMDITRGYLDALEASKSPRSILALPDVSIPDPHPRRYERIRSQWLSAEAIELPDVVDELVVVEKPKPVATNEIRVPVPKGVIHARLRQLDAKLVLRDIRGLRPKAEELERARAATLLLEVEGAFDALRAHYAAALRGLGLKVIEDSKWLEFDCASMKGQDADLIVTVSIQPSKANARMFSVGLTWVERGRKAKA